MADESQDLQHELGKLLQKNRSPEIGAKVNDILASGMPIELQIAEIRKLDAPKSYLSRPKKKQAPGADENTARPTVDGIDELLASDSSSLKRVTRHQQDIQTEHEETRFFEFLFKQYRKIRTFARDTLILEKSFLIPNFHLHSRVKTYWRDQLQKKGATPLVPILDDVLEYGWKVLEKEEYNLLVVLRRSCGAVAGFDAKGLAPRDKFLYDRMRPVLIPFFTVMAADPRHSWIRECIDKVARQLPDEVEVDPEYSRSLARFLTYTENSICFANVVRGMAMIKYRRFLEFHELFDSGEKDILWRDDFECNTRVRRSIHEYIEKIVTEIEPVRKRLDEIEKFHAFLPKNDESDIDESLLEKLYQYGAGVSRSFERDGQNVVRFVLNMTELFKAYCAPILSGPVNVGKGRQVTVFDPSLFAEALGRIWTGYEKMERLSFSMQNFPKRRFSDIRRTGKGAINVEAEAMMIIDEWLIGYLDLSSRLMAVLEASLPTPDGDPLTAELIAQRRFTIPHGEERVAGTGPFGGETIRLAVQQIASVCLLTAFKCESPMITRSLAQESQLKKEYAALLNVLERLCSRTAFPKVKERIEHGPATTADTSE